MSRPFRARMVVRFGDIDHAGIVYYPRFLHYFHVAIEEFFSERLGLSYAEVINQRGVGFPLVHLEIDFREPLRFGDEIDVEVRIERVGSSSIHWRYTVYRRSGSAPVAEARMVTVCIEMKTMRKSPVPDWLRRLLEGYREALLDATPAAG